MAIITLSKSESDLLYKALDNEILNAYEEEGAYENKNSRANKLDRIQSKIYQAANKGGRQ